MVFRRDLYNIFFLSVGFCSYIVSYNTSTNCMKYLLLSMRLDDKNFTVNAYLAQALHYIAFTFGPFYASIFVNKIGPRPAMFTAALLQVFYCSQFFFPANWSFYLSLFIRGAATGIIMVAQGRFLTENSTKQTISRNASFFSWLFSSSRIFGNLYLYLRFNRSVIVENQRIEMFALMVAANIFACLLFAILLKAKWNKPIKTDIKESYHSLWAIFRDKDIWLLVPSVAYNVMIMSFNIGVYANAVGFTESIKQQTPFKKITSAGMIMGFGCLFGSVSLTISKIYSNKYHLPAIIVGYVLNLCGFIMAFINLPKQAHHNLTWESGYIKCNYVIAMICPFLFGMGEMYLYSEINAITGQLYKDRVAHAFSFIAFIYGVIGIVTFILFNVLSFHLVLAMLSFVGLVSTICYGYLELKPSSRKLLVVRPYTFTSSTYAL